MHTALYNIRKLTGDELHRHIRFVRSLCLPEKIFTDATRTDLETLDWQWMVNYALRHGLGPLFVQGLAKLIPDFSIIKMFQDKPSDLKLPSNLDHCLIELLQNSYLSTLRRNASIQSVLKEIDRVLAQNGTTVILWKGAALINSVYPDIALRPMDDIDLLVRPEHLESLKTALTSLGFSPGKTYPMNWHRREIILDLHLDVVHADRISGRLKALPITAERVAQKACSVSGFRSFAIPSPCDALICSATHALKHGFSVDIWLADAFFLLNACPEIMDQPDMLTQRARDLGASMPLYMLFSLLQTWPQTLDLDFFPVSFSDKLGFFPNTFLRLFKENRSMPHVGELFNLFLLNAWPDRINFLLETMFPSKQVMQQLFPGASVIPYWFYYPHRLLRLLKMGIATFKSMVRSRR